MAFCTNCGASVPADAAFCPNCGRQVATYGTVDQPPAYGAVPPYGAEPPAPAAPADDYPARLQIDYPDRKLNRLSSFFRIFWVIPIAIVAEALSSTSSYFVFSGKALVISTGAVLVGPLVLMILFRRKYPWWWFDWNLELTRFTTRISAYVALMDDRYPSTDEEQSVHLELDRPDNAQLSRGMPLIKWFLAIPHYIVLFALAIGAFFVLFIVWVAILFTGRYPRWAFDYMLGVTRWSLRVQAYMFLLITDRYPPFSF